MAVDSGEATFYRRSPRVLGRCFLAVNRTEHLLCHVWQKLRRTTSNTACSFIRGRRGDSSATNTTKCRLVIPCERHGRCEVRNRTGDTYVGQVMNRSETEIRMGISDCLIRCNQAGSPVATLAECLEGLRKSGWDHTSMRRVEISVLRMLSGLSREIELTSN